LLIEQVCEKSAQVVRDTEDRLDVIECLGHAGYCRIERACVLRGVLRDATDAFLAVLDNHTLADLIKPHSALSSLLFDGRVAARATDCACPPSSAAPVTKYKGVTDANATSAGARPMQGLWPRQLGEAP
jgi:hypothetical protein